MSLVSLHAVLDFIRNAHSIILGRSSPASAHVSAPSDRKKYVVNVCVPRCYARATPLAYMVLIWGSSP